MQVMVCLELSRLIAIKQMHCKVYFAGSEWRAEYANTYRPHYAKNIENLID
jgi:hypothetical protein